MCLVCYHQPHSTLHLLCNFSVELSFRGRCSLTSSRVLLGSGTPIYLDHRLVFVVESVYICSYVNCPFPNPHLYFSIYFCLFYLLVVSNLVTLLHPPPQVMTSRPPGHTRHQYSHSPRNLRSGNQTPRLPPSKSPPQTKRVPPARRRYRRIAIQILAADSVTT